MGLPGAVDPVNDAGLGGGLAAAGGAGDQNHAVGQLAEGRHLLGDTQGLAGGDIEEHHPDHRRQGAALPVGIDAEAGQAGDGEGEVIVAVGQVVVRGAVGQLVDGHDQLLGLRGKDPLGADGDHALV